ncbi:MAG TPA: single-stranded DNA-binding protein [Mucilaginibacter sp.]|nr:single-stranded DNA-binding protein [Mucilaginibacter sp.]
MPYNSGVNRVLLLGSIADDPYLQVIEGEQMLCFRLSTVENLKRGDIVQEHIEWHNIKMPLEMARNAAELKTGEQVFIQGKVQTRVVFEDGVKLYRCEILATSISGAGTEIEYTAVSGK